MKESCSFIYRGKQYSKVGLLRVLSEAQPLVSENAREFMRSKLGMTDAEIIIVKGLIDGKSLGRFLQDGNILLSNLADDSVAYHEAFHRVFRMYLTPEERSSVHTEFKLRPNWKSLIAIYAKQYPENSENENIEEFIADEFSDYVLNNRNLKTPHKSIFDRILDFIKKLIGLKTSQISKLYKQIVEGKYSGKPLDVKYRYTRSADKVSIGESEYGYDIKNDFIQAVSKEFIAEVLKQGSVYDLINGKIDSTIQTELYKQSFIRIAEVLSEDYPQMVSDFLDDFDLGPEGYLNQQFKQYIETLVGKFDYTIIEESEQEGQENERGEEEAGRPNDDANRAWTASIEIDPKTNMSKAIKLVLASFTNNDKLNSLGLYDNVRWTNAFNKIAQHLAGVPTQDSIAHLSKLKEPYIQDLIEYLGGINPEPNSIDSVKFRLRNDFIKTFAKTRHTYMLAEIGTDGVKVFDANQNTQQKKKLREWNDNMQLAIKKSSDNGDLETWVKRLNNEVINSKTSNDALYAELLGINIADELKDQIVFVQNGQNHYYATAMKTLASIIVKSIEKNKFSNENPPAWNTLFNTKNFDIEGTLKKLATTQAEYEDVVDLMVFSRDKKLYGISQNTFATTTINTLNYISNLINKDDSLENKLKIVEKYLPTILNYQTVDLVNGEYVIKSKWLEHILSGNKINMVIVDGIKNEMGDSEALADVDESDLYATTLNLSLRNINISFKHSDRSIFYGYQMENGNIFDYQDGPYNTSKEIVDYLTAVLQSQLATEVKRSNLQNVPLFQYFKDKYKNSQLFDLKNIEDINAYSPDIQKMIRGEVQKNFDNYRAELIAWDVIDKPNGVQKGLSQDLIALHNDSVDLAIASSFAAQMLTHLEEMKIFLGDFAFFKGADDFYKRMSTTSGTGEILVNEEVTNARIQQANDIDFDIINPRTGVAEKMKYDKVIDGKFTSITSYEKDDYFLSEATELTKVSPIDGEQISEVQYLFEWNAMKDLGEMTDEIASVIKKSSKDYTANYNKINENDGQSWMNMFFFREYSMRLGTWTQAMENLFRAELKVLNAKSPEDLKNITISIGGEEVNMFDQQAWEDGWFESVHTLKSQYAGPTQAFSDYKNEVGRDISERIFPYTIYKTSYHILWPSSAIGTNLSQMHYFMLKNKVDVHHMNSANKSGAIDVKSVFQARNPEELTEDQKLVAKHGFNFYDQYGHFNDFIFEGEVGNQLLEQSLSVGQVDYLKDQVKIGNHEKDEIKGSTQSLKIMLSNLMNNGVERFEGAGQLIDDYKKTIAAIVTKSIDELLAEIGSDAEGVQQLESLVDAIKKSAQDRSSAINIIEAIEGFLYDPFMESLPNKTKLENIFYSIITNSVVSFNRPGNSYPQVASTGFEQIGERKVGSNMNIQSNDLLKFYTTEVDEEGNIIKVNPAEIIIPLPKEWINSVLTAAKTSNIAEGVEWINEQISKGKLDTQITFKGLRIPNQQLSSNDIFKIKNFALPTNVNYVVVPSALVTKVGSDFDIDKLSIYWSDSKNVFANKSFDYELSNPDAYTKDELYNILLQIEKKILLHPRNAHMLFMPVIDDLLKKDAFQQIVIDGKGQKRDSTTFMQALTPQKNVEKAIHFIKSKFGVGVVALDITGHSVFGSQNINLSPVYNNPNNQFKPTPTNLLFEGLENNYSLNSMYDANNRIISEVQSQTMNSQVDAGKDPYAVLLGINNQTLGTMMYLVRRGVPVITVLKFLSQPMIQQYLVEQRKNESIINKQRGKEISKRKLINKVYAQNGLSRPKLLDRNNSFSESDFEKGIKSGKVNKSQIPYFEYFMTLVDETSAFNDLKGGITVDTKGKKDKAAVENFETLWEKINMTQIISPEDLGTIRESSVLKPFFTAQELYRKIYFPFYALDKSVFGNRLKDFKDLVSSRQKGAFKKDKARTTIDNDFLILLIQNTHPDFNQEMFDLLFGFTSEKSLAQEIKQLLDNETYARNPVLKAFFPLISIAKDTVHSKMFDVVRLFERELSTIDLNDFIDAMKDIRDEISEDLYKSIIQVGLYQAGFNNSPFSLNKVFPTFKSTTRVDGKLTEFQNDYLREIQIATIKKIPQLGVEIMDQFEELFYRNNPEFATKEYSRFSPIKYFYTFSSKDNKRHLFYKADEDTPPVYLSVLGGTYFKRYFTSNVVGIESGYMKVTKNEDDSYEGLSSTGRPGEMIEYTPFEDVTNEGSINIYYGTNENKQLSNLASRPFTDIDGRKYYSVEHAYQSWKSGSFDATTYSRYKSGGIKLAGNKGTKTEGNWNVNLMKRLIERSLQQNPDILQLLINTGNAILTHNQDKGVWKTLFPQIMMELRSEMNLPAKQLDLFAEENRQEILKEKNNDLKEQGKLQMQPDNIVKIRSGQKTITNRKTFFEDGIYELPDGTNVKLKLEGRFKVFDDGTPRIYALDQSDQKLKSILKDDFAKAEGFNDWSDFENNNKYSSEFIKGNEIRYIYGITIGGTDEGSTTVNENQTDAKTLRETVLEDFENYFPDLAHYDAFEREIVASAVERGDIQITCKIG